MGHQTKGKEPTRQSLEQIEADRLNFERVQVQQQPHRRGDRGDMTDAFGTFLQLEFDQRFEGDCMRRCWEAGQAYIRKVYQWRRAKGIPQRVMIDDETPSSGGELDEKTIERWGWEIKQCEDTMKCSGLPGFRAANNLILEEVPVEVRLYGPAKRAIINLAICMGLLGCERQK